ncbi:hypothetical protein TIFTF001_053755, partial [Ficus carica]
MSPIPPPVPSLSASDKLFACVSMVLGLGSGFNLIILSVLGLKICHHLPQLVQAIGDFINTAFQLRGPSVGPSQCVGHWQLLGGYLFIIPSPVLASCHRTILKGDSY